MLHEAPYRVDRMLSQFHRGPRRGRRGGRQQLLQQRSLGREGSLSRAEAHHIGKLTLPAILRFLVGHTPLNATLPHGGPVELDADSGHLGALKTRSGWT